MAFCCKMTKNCSQFFLSAAIGNNTQFVIYDKTPFECIFLGWCVVVSLFNGTIIVIVFLWVVILWRLCSEHNIFSVKVFTCVCSLWIEKTCLHSVFCWHLVLNRLHLATFLKPSLQAAYIEIKMCFIPLNSPKRKYQ